MTPTVAATASLRFANFRPRKSAPRLAPANSSLIIQHSSLLPLEHLRIIHSKTRFQCRRCPHRRSPTWDRESPDSLRIPRPTGAQVRPKKEKCEHLEHHEHLRIIRSKTRFSTPEPPALPSANSSLITQHSSLFPLEHHEHLRIIRSKTRFQGTRRPHRRFLNPPLRPRPQSREKQEHLPVFCTKSQFSPLRHPPAAVPTSALITQHASLPPA